MSESPDLLWASGFFEASAQVSQWQGRVVVRLRRRNPEALIRFQSIVGLGVILDPPSERDERYTFRADDADVEAIFKQLRPWLSPGRALSIQTSLHVAAGDVSTH